MAKYHGMYERFYSLELRDYKKHKPCYFRDGQPLVSKQQLDYLEVLCQRAGQFTLAEFLSFNSTIGAGVMARESEGPLAIDHDESELMMYHLTKAEASDIMPLLKQLKEEQHLDYI